MDTQKISFDLQEPVVAESLGITPNEAYKFVIKSCEANIKSGISKKNEPYEFTEMTYNCEVLENFGGNIPTEACKGKKCQLRFSTGMGEPSQKIAAYNRGVLESMGIQVSNWGSLETIAAETMGKTFIGFVKEDKAGFPSIHVLSLRRFNKG